MTELIALAGGGSGAVQRELARLEQSGLARVSRLGARKHYQASPDAEFCRQHGIRQLSFFGSVMRDDFRPDSDVDVMVEFQPGRKPDLFDIVDLQDALVRLFHGRPVDVMTNPLIRNPFRRQSIQRDLALAYAA